MTNPSLPTTTAEMNPTSPTDNNHRLNNNESYIKKRSYDQKYGCSRSCSPPCLQFLGNKYAFLIIFSLTCILQGTFRTYFVAVITTIEKLFKLESKTIGLLLSATEIGQVSSSLILPYYAGNGHRPHWMGIGSAIFAIGILFCSSPHWLLPSTIQYDTNTTLISSELCYSFESFQCRESTSASENYYIFIILFLSLLSVGLGQTAINLLGIPYLDDNVGGKESPVYFAITIGVRILGPVAGFILGALCTKLYINPLNPPSNIKPNDPRWIGAWWLGMIIIGSVLLLTSLLLYGFPKEMKPQPTPNHLRRRPLLRHFPSTILRLLKNKLLLLRTFSSVFHLLPIAGLYTFLPKYLESQYSMAAHEANLYTGISGILIMGIGIFSSGFIIRNYGGKIGGKGIAGWICGAAGVYAVGMLALVWIGGCDVGVSQVEFGSGGSGEVDLTTPLCPTPSCTHCKPSYQPICSNQITYLSPCHAGCTNYTSDNYTNCSCITPTTAQPTICPTTCSPWNFRIYLLIFMFIVLIHSTSEVGSMLLTLRCVKRQDKAMALGLIQFSIGLFGNVPCAIIYGIIIDSTCVLWGGGCGGGAGNCWIYDKVGFRMVFHGLTSSLMFIAFIIDLFVYFNADKINLEEEEATQPAPATPIELQPLNKGGN